MGIGPRGPVLFLDFGKGSKMEVNEIARRMVHIELRRTFDVLREAICRGVSLKDKLPGHVWTISRWLSEGQMLNLYLENANKPKKGKG